LQGQRCNFGNVVLGEIVGENWRVEWEYEGTVYGENHRTFASALRSVSKTGKKRDYYGFMLEKVTISYSPGSLTTSRMTSASITPMNR